MLGKFRMHLEADVPYYVAVPKVPPVVYVLTTEDRFMFKLGFTTDLKERVTALTRDFKFDLNKSVCFIFAGARQARFAEQELIAYLEGCQVEFEAPFPGSSEYFHTDCLLDLFKAVLDKHFRGFITMKRVADALGLQDYEPPSVS